MKHPAYEHLKRSIDIIGAVTGLLLLCPVHLAVAVVVRHKLGRPVLFTQSRPGKDGKDFRMIRSMTNPDETRGLVTNEQRMTPFGRKLRSSSLDELPSLWNVLRGDMSLVGPRPLRRDYLSRYNARQAKRHEVAPGLTGLAQIMGRNNISWDERLEYDVQYVENRSLRLDLRILWLTIARVVQRGGIEGDGMAAMSAFMGSADTSDLNELDLDEKWLDVRVSWLRSDSVRKGVSLSFTPELAAMRGWFDQVKIDAGRRDWVYTTAEGTPVSMCGLSGIGTPDLSLYIYVNPEHQRQGYGRASMQKLIMRAESFGAYRLHLDVKSSNFPAISLYRSLGFVDDAKRFPEKLSLVLPLSRALEPIAAT